MALSPYCAILYQEEAMSIQGDPISRMHLFFEQEPCWQIDGLADTLSYSVPSVRRFLVQCGYYSSFTHNATWYTLASIPRFGRGGLWFKDTIGFSRVGSLTRTLEHLVGRSPDGMTAEELGLALRCRCHAVLVSMHRAGRLCREKMGRSYVYMSADRATTAKQRQAREQQLTAVPSLPAEVAVLILAEFIRHPQATSAQLADALARGRHIRVRPEQVEKLFELHGVKKKT
jgi:hypothetical protein